MVYAFDGVREISWDGAGRWLSINVWRNVYVGFVSLAQDGSGFVCLSTYLRGSITTSGMLYFCLSFCFHDGMKDFFDMFFDILTNITLDKQHSECKYIQ